MLVSRFVNWWYLMIIVYISVLISVLLVVCSLLSVAFIIRIFLLISSLSPLYSFLLFRRIDYLKTVNFVPNAYECVCVCVFIFLLFAVMFVIVDPLFKFVSLYRCCCCCCCCRYCSSAAILNSGTDYVRNLCGIINFMCINSSNVLSHGIVRSHHDVT